MQNQVTSLPDELDELAKKYTRSDTQSDMKQAMERQAESFDKLQSQYDTIVDIQKQMDVLPEITARLDNMTELHTQVPALSVCQFLTLNVAVVPFLAFLPTYFRFFLSLLPVGVAGRQGRLSSAS